MSRHYTVLLEWDPEEPGYAVTVPSLPGCFAQGAIVPDALERAREAVSGLIAALIEMGEPLPTNDSSVLMKGIEVEDTVFSRM